MPTHMEMRRTPGDDTFGVLSGLGIARSIAVSLFGLIATFWALNHHTFAGAVITALVFLMLAHNNFRNTLPEVFSEPTAHQRVVLRQRGNTTAACLVAAIGEIAIGWADGPLHWLANCLMITAMGMRLYAEISANTAWAHAQAYRQTADLIAHHLRMGVSATSESNWLSSGEYPKLWEAFNRTLWLGLPRQTYVNQVFRARYEALSRLNDLRLGEEFAITVVLTSVDGPIQGPALRIFTRRWWMGLAVIPGHFENGSFKSTRRIFAVSSPLLEYVKEATTQSFTTFTARPRV